LWRRRTFREDDGKTASWRDKDSSKSETYLSWENSSDFSSMQYTGHALLDDALGAFKLMHTHMRLTRNAQVVFHEGCDVIYGPGIVTGTIRGQAALDRCRKFEAMLVREVSSRKPLHLFRR
jgi:hypothetical protein